MQWRFFLVDADWETGAERSSSPVRFMPEGKCIGEASKNASSETVAVVVRAATVDVVFEVAVAVVVAVAFAVAVKSR
jgi:hypothetical protein